MLELATDCLFQEQVLLRLTLIVRTYRDRTQLLDTHDMTTNSCQSSYVCPSLGRTGQVSLPHAARGCRRLVAVCCKLRCAAVCDGHLSLAPFCLSSFVPPRRHMFGNFGSLVLLVGSVFLLLGVITLCTRPFRKGCGRKETDDVG